MVDSDLPAGRPAPPGGIAIATAKKRKTRAPARRAPRPARSGRGARTSGRKATPARGGQDSYPLGEGVADGFAMDRLAAPARMKRTPKRAVRELGWAAFGEVARLLSGKIAVKFRPAAVIGVAKGGVFVGGAIAAVLGAEFYPVRIEKRRRDPAPFPDAVVELPDLKGKKVLVVDDVAATGATLARARALARKAGAKEVRTAVLVARPRGARPDFAAYETDELVLFAWDYQLDATGSGTSGTSDPGEVGV